MDRSHLMADDAHFLFPVVIDDTPNATARVPDKFREVQWTRLRVEETPRDLATRVAKLLAAGGELPSADRTDDEEDDPRQRRRAKKVRRPAWVRTVWSLVGLFFAVFYLFRPMWRPSAPVTS